MKRIFVLGFLLLIPFYVQGKPFELTREPKEQSRLFDKMIQREKIVIRIVEEANPENPSKQYGPWVQKAFTKWSENVLKRLEDHAAQREALKPYMSVLEFGADANSYQIVYDNSVAADITVYLVSQQGLDYYCHGAAGCAYYAEYKFYVGYPKDLTEYKRTVIHEIGHLYNMEDLYNGMVNGKKYRNVFGSSIMNYETSLSCDDADGFVYMLHAIMDGEEKDFEFPSFCQEDEIYQNGYLKHTKIRAIFSLDLLSGKVYANCPQGPTQLLAEVNWGNFPHLITMGKDLSACLRALGPERNPAYTEVNPSQLAAHFHGAVAPETQIFRKVLIPHALELYVHVQDGMPFYAYVLNLTESRPAVQFLFAKVDEKTNWIYVKDKSEDAYVFVESSAIAGKKDLLKTYYRFFSQRFALAPYNEEWGDLADNYPKEARKYKRWEQLPKGLPLSAAQRRNIEQNFSQQIREAIGK